MKKGAEVVLKIAKSGMRKCMCGVSVCEQCKLFVSSTVRETKALISTKYVCKMCCIQFQANRHNKDANQPYLSILLIIVLAQRPLVCLGFNGAKISTAEHV